MAVVLVCTICLIVPEGRAAVAIAPALLIPPVESPVIVPDPLIVIGIIT